MATQQVLARVSSLLRSWIEAEAAADWAFVRRVPSTYTWKSVDYLRRLAPERRGDLFDAFVTNALFFFDPSRAAGLHPGTAKHPEFLAMIDSLPLTWSWEYENVRALRAMLAEQKSAGGDAGPPVPQEILERASAIRPTNSREIRSEVMKAFSERFGARPEKFGGGVWRYAGTHGQHSFVVTIDYGGWDQLRYEVDYFDGQADMQVTKANYERLVGAGLGHWNFLTADNLHESVELLVELVGRLVTLPDRLLA